MLCYNCYYFFYYLPWRQKILGVKTKVKTELAGVSLVQFGTENLPLKAIVTSASNV